jgi:glycosyltransferase involved in cell wall biosynthesis
MHILHVPKKYPTAVGGDAVLVSAIEKEQARLGHDVFILTSNCKTIVDEAQVTKFGLLQEEASLDHVSVKRILSLGSLLFESLLLILRLQPDVIHTHSIDLGVVVSFTARLFHIPVVHTCHSLIFDDATYSPAKRALEVFLLRIGRFDAVTVLSEDKVRKLARLGLSNAVFVPNGVDVAFWRKQAQETEHAPFTFLVVGRLEEHKGLNFLFDAAVMLKEEGRSFRILVAGDGTQKAQLRSLAQSLQIADAVEFLGTCSRERLRDLYGLADALLLSSYSEGLPLTILEAWAAEVPVVAAEVGSIPSICSDSVNALLVQPRRADMLSRAMARIMDDNQLRISLARAGREVVSSSYDIRRICHMYMTQYDRILQ